MGKIILVVSASAKGSTPEIAQALGNELQEAGYSVEVADTNDIVSLKGCTAVVFGIPLSTVCSGKDDLCSFKHQFSKELAQIPVAAFSAGLFYEGLKQERIDALMTTLKEILSPLQPLATGVFVGTLGQEKAKPENGGYTTLQSPGPFPDPGKIRDWAQALPSLLDLRPSGTRIAGTPRGGV